MNINEKIIELTIPVLESINAFLVDLHILHGKKGKTIQLNIDTDDGITLDQCAEINRKLGTIIEQSQIIEGSYVLQVSSPGLKKPLKLLRQYKKNIGRKYKVRYKQNEKINEIIATLISIENQLIIFSDLNDKKYEILYDEILECIEQLAW